MKGKMIVVEGLDGSGKSTQAALLKEKLEKENISVYQIKLPNYSDDSSTLVRMYLDGQFGDKPEDVNAYAASTFYAVDRYASYKKHWQKEYRGGLILADRYTTSNAVHQMTKLPKYRWDAYLDWLFDFEYNLLGIPEPDCVIFLDMPVEISQKLMTQRYGGDENKKDVHERDVEYLKKCYNSAKYAAERCGWETVRCFDGDSARSIDDISRDVFDCVMKNLK
ncbi:MAG: deoxynucleoside kinase [Oscillospiraceae bacterium]|nr:deoxynucleoside kinase [Oscillospiraceae bacterium]